MSRSAVPGALEPWVCDQRRLGVQVARLAWWHGTERVDVALDGAALADGGGRRSGTMRGRCGAGRMARQWLRCRTGVSARR